MRPEIPAGYTDLGDGDERLVANGWHWGVGRRLLAMLMALTVAQPAEASVPAAPRTTTVSWMAAQFGGGPLDMSPPPRLAPADPLHGHPAPAAGAGGRAGYGAHRHMAPRCGADPRRGAG